ncbi:class I SAM-dependent methyltransferase [Seongchinamella unica]|uniref:Class I SAM-dependent methyltransferase n=1 Tax=Seongchinamella unica TaxID=2547392 RepID=A0A4R5LVI2_9GAMM|nr:class I SAM-dependent methyltransferase [Seongchinamella unica]TDG15412.1 class I SAM-dependent methyltransferase [Seongchinamella unica]
MSAPTAAELLELQESLYVSRNPTRRWLHRSRRDWVVSMIRRWGENSKNALEVGPGSGVYLPELADVAQQVVAADIEEAYLAQARSMAESETRLSVVCDDITATRLPADNFQLVLCTEVIEHIADSRAAIAGLAGLVSEEGVLILTTPQKYSPLELFAKIAFLPGIIQLVKWVYREPVIPTGHINLLTESELLRQVAASGLVVESAWKCGFYLPLVAELGGDSGCRFLQWCERKLRGSALSWLLWTQCYLLRPGGRDD